jgi:hypothetical protein
MSFDRISFDLADPQDPWRELPLSGTPVESESDFEEDDDEDEDDDDL